MPAHRKPTALLEASGAFAKNPGRRADRENEPVPEGPLGDPPEEWLRDEGINARCRELLRAWREIVEQAPFGVLTCSDRDHVEATCYLKYKIRQAAKGIGKATSGDYAQLNKNLSQMGLIPSERSRVSAKRKAVEAASEWALLAEEQQERRQANGTVN